MHPAVLITVVQAILFIILEISVIQRIARNYLLGFQTIIQMDLLTIFCKMKMTVVGRVISLAVTKLLDRLLKLLGTGIGIMRRFLITAAVKSLASFLNSVNVIHVIQVREGKGTLSKMCINGIKFPCKIRIISAAASNRTDPV